MVHLIYGGGLGNQMFQYSFARTLQEKYGLDVAENYEHYKVEKERSYALEPFAVKKFNQISTTRQKVIYRYTKAVQNLLGIIYRKKDRFGQEFCKTAAKFGLVYTPNTYKYLDLFSNRNNQILIGAFQSWKYFEPYSDIIKSELKVIQEPSAENRKMLEEISGSNAICVHIRRGDYVNSRWSKTLDICGFDYYKRAMRFISERVENPRFFVFTNSSDDADWILNNYHFEYPVKYVKLENPDYEELRLMYSCKHFIISNSTFSWWAQYLSDNPLKIICAPDRWNRREDIDCSDIYMPGWNLINTD